MSIKKSIRILLIAASMIPVILVSVLAHGFLTNKLIDVNTDNLVRTSNTSISGLESLIMNQQTEVTLLSLQNELIDFTRQNNRTANTLPESMNELLRNRCRIYNYCEHILLFNKRQEIIASSDSELVGTKNQSEKSLNYMFTTKNTAVGMDGLKLMNKDGGTIYTLDIGAPILDPTSGMVLGYIVSTISTDYFRSFLNSLIIDDTGFAILLDMNGNIIYHPDNTLVGTKISSNRLSGIVTDYNNGFIEKSGSFQYYYEDMDQVYGYCVLPKLNWVLLMKQDTASIKSLTNFMLSLLTAVCVLLLIVISLCSNFVAKQYSTPIIALRDAMRTASDGNLTVQSNIKSNNELGELSKNFNKMLHIIRTNYQDLESMHEELLLNEEQLRSNYDHIEFLAYHDTLTNLPNKLAFLDYVNAVLMSSSPQEALHAVYFVDLDNFKTVNDTLGHEYGDALLVKTAALLTSVLNSDGMLARAGGDEFLLFRENIPSTEDAVWFASKIIEVFKNPLDLDGEIVYVSMSIGISIYPENGLTSNVLIKNADIAMYKSKDTGKNKFTLFDRKMEEELNRHTLIIDVLRNAIENNEIYLQYQPLMELETNNVIGYEALMRIYNERLGYIAPSEFIPIAEESGLIIQLSSWLLREACTFTKNMIDSGATPRPVSVNISSVQINRPGFVSTLSEILEETKLPPEYLELEITESTLVSSLMDATKLLRNLQRIGVKISLDDFGTGYSSLNYLTKMPIDTLKIDKSFIDNICTNEKDSCIAESIILLAHSLDIRVVAEGVEQEEQLCLLRSKRCDIVQGYVYSPPLHPEDLLEVIKEDDLVTQCTLF
jgi:diguanylate cyclase (GGDEF)-like protein